MHALSACYFCIHLKFHFILFGVKFKFVIVVIKLSSILLYSEHWVEFIRTQHAHTHQFNFIAKRANTILDNCCRNETKESPKRFIFEVN